MNKIQMMHKRLVAVTAGIVLAGVLTAAAQDYCETRSVMTLEPTSATLTAFLRVSVSSVESYGIQLSRDTTITIASGQRQPGDEPNRARVYRVKFSGLERGTQYYFRAFCYDGFTYRVGKWESFTTQDPHIRFDLFTTREVSSNRAVLYSEVTIETPVEFQVYYEYYISDKDSTASQLMTRKNLIDRGNSKSLKSDHYDKSEPVSNLTCGTRYWCMLVIRAYDVVVESEVHSFVTPGLQPVDLGLPSGTLWSPCDLGSISPLVAGDAYLWGETVPVGKEVEYSSFHPSYKWFQWGVDEEECRLSKYNFVEKSGVRDDKRELEAQDDPATATLGSSWRTPTREQFQELIDNCFIGIYRIDHGMVRLVSKINSRSIVFTLPQKMIIGGKKTYLGVYWTRNLSPTDPMLAGSALITYTTATDCEIEMTDVNRGRAFSLRPVWNK